MYQVYIFSEKECTIKGYPKMISMLLCDWYYYGYRKRNLKAIKIFFLSTFEGWSLYEEIKSVLF